MDLLFKYIEKKVKNTFKAKCVFKKKINKFIVKNSYYTFVLTKQESFYLFSYKWKLGILGRLFFNKYSKDMRQILKIINDYTEKNNIVLSIINKNS